jgi:hypothetical protein
MPGDVVEHLSARLKPRLVQRGKFVVCILLLIHTYNLSARLKPRLVQRGKFVVCLSRPFSLKKTKTPKEKLLSWFLASLWQVCGEEG